ncbi:MAG: ATP synthase F1 subunit delta [Oscillospiraceae bacterium]|nr:ATP synthase F1 subunit delta [Oscillospiraceae bacterium]
MGGLALKVYSESLFSVFLENDCLEEGYRQILFIKESFENDKEIIDILSFHSISKIEKQKILLNIFEGKLLSNIFNFLFLIIDNERMSSIIYILDQIKFLYMTYTNTIEVDIITAIILSNDLEDKIVKKLSIMTKKNIVIQNIIDEKIIGGVIIRGENLYIDGSVKTSINDMKKYLDSMLI